MVLLWAACVEIHGQDIPGIGQAPPRVRVVQVEHPGATAAYQPQPAIVRDMVRLGMLKWTGKNDLKAAWLSVVSVKDVVGLKVYSHPGANSGTRPAVVEAIVQGLLAAGLPSTNIIVWDKSLLDLRLAGFADLANQYHIRLIGSSDVGYEENVRYTNSIIGTLIAGDMEFDQHGTTSSRYSHVSKLLTSNITKIISVAPLLNHNEAGACGHLYGPAMGSVDNVARFEDNAARLAQAVPEIYAMPSISDHVALNITDALISQYQGEQTSMLHYSTELNQIWISNDPVALDLLGIAELDRERAAKNIESHRDNPELYQNAAILQLGVDDLSKVKLEVIR